LKNSILVILLFFLSLFSTNTKGQNGKIVVIDSKSKELIPFAHVCFEELGTGKKFYHVTDKDGAVINPISKTFVIAISFIGYKSYIDTLQPIKNYQIELIPQIFDLDQVVVTASFTPQKADKSIYNVKVIDSRSIEQKSATNLSDILKDEVNIQVTNDAVLGSGLKIKGLSGNNVKILIDGVPVIGRMGGNVDLNQLNLYNVDHVEVVEGPMSVVYGSNALAGAINIITKENLHSSFNSTINSYAESVGKYNVNASTSFNKGKNSFSFAGGWNFFNGVYFDKDTNRSQQWKPKEQYNVDSYYAYTTEKSKLKFQTSVMNERLLDKGDQISPIYRFADDSWFKTLRLTNRLEYNYKIGSNYYLNMLGSFSYFNRRKYTYMKDFTENTSILVNDWESNDTTIFKAFTYRAIFGNQSFDKKFSFLSGLDLDYETVTGKRILDNKQTIGDYALFTSLMLNISKNLSLQPGLRAAKNTLTNVPLIPSINLKWAALPFLNIRASYTRGYRTPTLKELYILFKDSSHDIRPNDTLKSEWGHNFDISFNINTDRTEKIHFTNLEFELFYNRMHDKIDLAIVDSANNQGVYKYVNISNYNTLGGKVSFKYSFYTFFDLGIGFGETGTYASFTKNNDNLTKYKFSPEANVNLSILVKKFDFKIITSYKYYGENWQFNIDENKKITIGHMDTYQNLDLSLMKKFLKNRMTVTIGSKNIFNNKLVKNTGRTSDTPHSSSDGSAVGYGRVFFTSLSLNVFK
jgi:outer membrane receptor for ferrienterochelin and colicins